MTRLYLIAVEKSSQTKLLYCIRHDRVLICTNMETHVKAPLDPFVKSVCMSKL